jgi:hypothetical protein
VKSLTSDHGLLVASLFLALLGSAVDARAEIVLSKIKVESDPAKVEVHNTGASTVSLNGWMIRNQSATSETALFGDIGPDGRRIFNLNGNVAKRGDCLELFDPDLDSIVDRILFGHSGPAPLDIDALPNSAISRAQGGADPTGVNSATNWTVEFDAIFGSPNNALPPQLDPDLLINEITPIGLSVFAELYNNTSLPINISGYRLTTGQDHQELFGTVPPGDFLSFDITQLDFEFSLNLYLFRNDDVRIDQMGLTDSPLSRAVWLGAKLAGLGFGRCPDGNGPQAGFNLETSGFPITLKRAPPSQQFPNECEFIPGVPFSRTAAAGTALLLLTLAIWRLRRRGAFGVHPGD